MLLEYAFHAQPPILSRFDRQCIPLPREQQKFDQAIPSMQEAQTRVSIPKSIPITLRATLVRFFFCIDVIKTMN